MANELARQRYARKNEQDELERVFKTLDRNADGKVDPEELGLLFQMLNHKVSELPGIPPSKLLSCTAISCTKMLITNVSSA